MILLIDNYDSFSYNLFQYVGELGTEMKVIRNDELSVEEIAALKPSHLIISPGPGRPSDAGVIEEAVKKLPRDIKILGVCLGHQAICEAFGATVTYAKKLMHGKQSEVKIDKDSGIFKNLPEHIKVARYHSLAVDESTLPDCIKPIAKTADGEIMAVKHTEYPIFGVQFHPESILTPDGKTILGNFIKL